MRRNPDDPFDDLFRQIERMMEGVMGGMRGGGSFDAEVATDTHVDVREYDDRVTVMADLPGVSKADIDLQCDGRTLSIAASTETRHYDERVPLPVAVDETSATARYNNGVLEVTFERAEGSADISLE